MKSIFFRSTIPEGAAPILKAFHLFLQEALEKCIVYLKRPVLQNVLDSEDCTGSSLGWDEVIDFVDVLVKQNLQKKNAAKDTTGTREERDAAINLFDLVVTLSIRSTFQVDSCFFFVVFEFYVYIFSIRDHPNDTRVENHGLSSSH